MVERIPTSARWEDGPLIEFPVSLPSPATAKLAATPEAVPPLDPAGTRSRSYAFAVVSYEELTVCLALKAHSAMLVLAITTASASRTRRTMKASSGGRLPIRAIEPPVVGRSCVSKLSFTSMGTQNSGPSSSPAATAASISSALPRALAFTTVIAFTVDSSYASIRSRWVCTTIRHVVRPSLMDSWIRAIVDSTTSMGCAVGPQAAAARAKMTTARHTPKPCITDFKSVGPLSISLPKIVGGLSRQVVLTAPAPGPRGHGPTIGVLLRVLRIAPRTRAAEHGDRTTRPAQRAQAVGELRRLCEGPDEHEVALVGELFGEVFVTPSRDDLRHDAGEVGIHHARIQVLGWSSCDEIDDGDSELAHAGAPSCVAVRETLRRSQLPAPSEIGRIALRTSRVRSHRLKPCRP